MRVHNNYRAANLLTAVKLRVSPRYAAVSAFKSAVRRCAAMTKECSRLKNCACLPRNELCEVEKVAAIYNPKILYYIYIYIYISRYGAIKEKCSLNSRHIMSRVRISHHGTLCLFLGRYRAVSMGIGHRFPRGGPIRLLPQHFFPFRMQISSHDPWHAVHFITRRAADTPKMRHHKFLTARNGQTIYITYRHVSSP